MSTQIERILDLSGGIQSGTSWQLRKPNEVEDAVNARFGDVIGSIVRRPGFARKGNVLQANKTGLGLTEGKWLTGSQVLGAINNSGDTETKIKSYDQTSGNWTDLTTPNAIAPNTRVQFEDSLNETYAAGMSSAGTRMEILNITTSEDVVPVIQVSNTKNLLNAPKARFITEFGGSLYAMNCQIGSTIYADRAYKSSPALGIITFVQGAQADVASAVDLVDNVPTMTSATTPLGVVATSSEFSSVYAAWKIFDDSVADRDLNMWNTAASNTSGFVSYDFGSGNAKTITYYSVVGVCAIAPNNDLLQAPKTWTFEGSNNGSSWTVLDTQTNVASWARAEKRIYSISNTTAYRYYRYNVSANQGDPTYLNVSELELLTSAQGTKDLQLKLDSVRYIKTGMTLEIYKGGTTTKLFTILVNSVDKPNNTIAFTPYTLSFATTDVNTTTEIITLSSTANFPTGTTIKFSSTGGVPAGLVADTTYYAINVSPTTIKVANSLANAKLGVAVNLTSQGTGTHTILLSYQVSDNDEIWLTGRYGKLTYFWNTDYPTAQKADYLRVPPSVDSDSAITGYAKGNNRLLIFTKNSTYKWDKANFTTIYDDIGCISHETIESIGDWVIWLDAEGKVRARNDSTGQSELISRPVKTLLAGISEANLATAAAGRIDNTYKLCLGTVGSSVLRLIYDFDTNTWAHDITSIPMTAHMRSAMGGTKKLYFLSNTGRMYEDDSGTLDDTDTIPFIVKIGRTMNRIENLKNYHGLFIYSGNAVGATIKYALDGSDQFVPAGQLKHGVDKIPISGMQQVRGRDIDVQISINTPGAAPYISALMYYYSQEEDKFGQPTR